MMNVRFAEVDGVRMATLPAADYEKLIDAAEDRADARAAEAAEARRNAGEEYVPSAVVDRILAGENPLRVWRQYRGLTLAKLGASAAIKSSYLSEMELGKKSGSPRVWRALADELGVDVDDIMIV